MVTQLGHVMSDSDQGQVLEEETTLRVYVTIHALFLERCVSSLWEKTVQLRWHFRNLRVYVLSVGSTIPQLLARP